MTIEDALYKHAEAINNLADALRGKGQMSLASALNVAEKANAKAAVAVIESDIQPPVEVKRGRPKKLEVTPSLEADADPVMEATTLSVEKAAMRQEELIAQKYDYTKDIAKPFLDLVLSKTAQGQDGQAIGVALLKEFGVSNAKELRPEQYEAFTARLKQETLTESLV